MKAIRLKNTKVGHRCHKLTRVSQVQNSRDPVTLALFCEIGWCCRDRLGGGIEVDKLHVKSFVSCKKIDKNRAGWKLLLWSSCSLSHLLGTLIFAASSSCVTHKWPHLRPPCTSPESKGAEAMGTHRKAGAAPIFHCGGDRAPAQDGCPDRLWSLHPWSCTEPFGNVAGLLLWVMQLEQGAG